jgi:hypothetical protein
MTKGNYKDKQSCREKLLHNVLSCFQMGTVFVHDFDLPNNMELRQQVVLKLLTCSEPASDAMIAEKKLI